MATLESAAESLVEKLKTFDQEVEEAGQRFSSLENQVRQALAQFGEDWSALIDDVQGYLEKVQETRGKLAEAGQEAAEALAETQETLGASQGDASAEIADTRSQVSGVTEQVKALEPETDELMAQGVEAPAKSLLEQAEEVKEDLEKALTETAEFLENDVISGLQETGEAIRERAQRAREALEAKSEELQVTYDEWERRLLELEGLVEEQGFRAAQDHVREVVDYALAECAKDHQDELGELVEIVDVLEGTLGELVSEVEVQAERIEDDGREPLEERTVDTLETLTAAQQALERVRDLLASFTFVRI